MKNVNSERGHFIAPFTNINTPPTESAWEELADGIEDISDATTESTEEKAYYNGVKTNIVNSVSGAYNVSGDYDSEDKAQEIIADMKYKTGIGRKVWHRVVSADKTKQWTGHATVTDIVAGSGAADATEDFSCTITFDAIPTEGVPGTGGGGAGNADISLNSASADNKSAKNSKKDETK